MTKSRRWRDLADELDGPRRQLAFVPRLHAVEQRADRHVLVTHGGASAFESSQVEQIADDPFQAMRLLIDDPKVAVARGLVEIQLRHRQCLDVAAHRREWRHQFMRHIRQELTPRLVRRFECPRAVGELVAHLVERSRQRRNLVTTAVGSARRHVARTEADGRLLELLHPAARRPEHEQRDQA